MTSARPPRVAILTVLALALNAAYALPARSVATLTARSCCAGHCHHTRSQTAANRCCHVPPSDGGQATLSPSPTQHLVLQAAAVAAAVAAGGSPIARQPFNSIAPPLCRTRSAPLFLVKRSLRC
jgi:hypothetical protein